MNIRQRRKDTCFLITMEDHTKARLAKQCFRGTTVNRAGNISHWENPEQMFADSFIMKSLLDDAEIALRHTSKNNSFTLNYGADIGWSGLDHRNKYCHDELEIFRPNKRSKALRVRPSLRHYKAPKTYLITIIYEIAHKDGEVILTVRSLYPGPDIGELIGNITEDENCVFYSLEHEGEQEKAA